MGLNDSSNGETNAKMTESVLVKQDIEGTLLYNTVFCFDFFLFFFFV